MEKYKGIFTALLTPFDKNGRVNETELERLAKFNLKRFFFTICVNTKNGIKYRMAIGRESRKTA